MKKKGLIGGVAAAVLIVVALVTVLFCTERIPAGYVGVVYNMNGSNFIRKLCGLSSICRYGNRANCQ